jgi:hypothetical protein
LTSLFVASSAQSLYEDFPNVDCYDAKAGSDRLKELRIEKNQRIDPEVENLDSIAERRQWEDAAMAWLDLICLHQTAYMSLSKKSEPTPLDEQYKNFLLTADFKHVEASQEVTDNQLFVKRYFDNFEISPGQTLTTDQATSIKNHLLKSGRGFHAQFKYTSAEPTGFNGTYHCETLLMCLYLVGRLRKDLVDENVDANSPEYRQYYLRLLPKSITEALQNALDVLPVSKRCCPGCHALVTYLRKKYKSYKQTLDTLQVAEGVRVTKTYTKSLCAVFCWVSKGMVLCIMAGVPGRAECINTDHLSSPSLLLHYTEAVYSCYQFTFTLEDNGLQLETQGALVWFDANHRVESGTRASGSLWFGWCARVLP